MKKVITYGTYDLLHYGHIRLLERAKELGDYLIVGVTADDFDRRRGKINVHQTLMERIDAVKATGLADEIIVEEYEGQKIDDIKKYDVDIFTVGSDWVGKFDYLNQYCEVVYLDRTMGISSTELRSKNRIERFGLVGNNKVILKYINESSYVNGLSVSNICTTDPDIKKIAKERDINVEIDYEKFLDDVDCVYIASNIDEHFYHIEMALNNNKHVLCESPMCMSDEDCSKLYELAKSRNLILMEAIKTAYSTAFNRLILLIKSGVIGDVVSIDATCTSLKEFEELGENKILKKQNSISAWGPTALLPIFMIFGTKYEKKHFSSYFLDGNYDLFTKIDLIYKDAVASVKVGKGVKSEGSLVISGTKGYFYIPAPWWKTDYFEARFENPYNNKKYFYKLDGEGIRNELVTFAKSIEKSKNLSYIDQNISEAISLMIEKFYDKEDLDEIFIKRNE